jgi:hypothetical protein
MAIQKGHYIPQIDSSEDRKMSHLAFDVNQFI